MELSSVDNIDPENEVYGWIDSVIHTHHTWITKIKTGIVDKRLATFDDAVKAQVLFFKALNLYLHN